VRERKRHCCPSYAGRLKGFVEKSTLELIQIHTVKQRGEGTPKQAFCHSWPLDLKLPHSLPSG